VLAITNEEEWDSLCKAIGTPEWTADPRFSTMSARKANEDELNNYLAEWTSRFSKQEVMEVLQKTAVPAGAVQDIGDILDRDPQVRARKLYPRMEHPVMGRCYHGGWPFILSRTPTFMTTSPCLGADSEYVLNQLLGVGDERLIELLEKGVLE
jgi:crotonobetainyl-CoA:carnitine CoA-transferase CaiB-like acyl-CoA transferase